MLPNDNKLLIDHLDKTLTGQSIPEVEHLISNDPEAQQEWQYLQLGVEAIRHNSLYEQVGIIKEQWQKERNDRANRLRMLRNMMRMAAAVILLAGVWIGYKYFTVTTSHIYSNYYTEYSLVTSRSNTVEDKLEQAWRNKNWQEVITAFNAAGKKDNKALFLAGLAYLEMQQPVNAVRQFTHVLDNNTQTGDTYFREEAEYYLSMAYLSAGNGQEALSLLLKIRADKTHLYHSKVNEIPGIDFKIMKQKFRSVNP